MIGEPETLVGTHSAISLFSGCGGLDLGVAAAGFNVLASVEIDPHAVASLRSWTDRLPHHHRTYHADITSLDPARLMIESGLAPGELDLLIGGPPCQSFSGIGFRQGLDDSRGLLLFEMVRFAEVLRPRAILIEQVKALVNFTTREGGRVLHMLQKGLSDMGYATWWSVLNAADYGAPQKRERIIIVALRTTDQFAFPAPVRVDAKLARQGFGYLPHLTVADGLAGLPRPVRRHQVTDDPSHVDVTPERDQDRIHHVPEGQWLSAQTHLPIELRGKLSKKDTTKYRRLDRTVPSLTLRCGEIHYHPVEDRYLTPREYLRLHGYPDWFTLIGPIRSRSGRVKDLDQHRQVANSVPPPLGHAVAVSVRAALERSVDADGAGVARVRNDGSVARSDRESSGLQMSFFGSGMHGGK